MEGVRYVWYGDARQTDNLKSPHFSLDCDDSEERINTGCVFRKPAGGGCAVVGMWNVYLSNAQKPFSNINSPWNTTLPDLLKHLPPLSPPSALLWLSTLSLLSSFSLLSSASRSSSCLCRSCSSSFKEKKKKWSHQSVIPITLFGSQTWLDGENPFTLGLNFSIVFKEFSLYSVNTVYNIF